MPLQLDIKKTLSANSDRVKCVDQHPTEPWLLCSQYSGVVNIWNYETIKQIKTFTVCDLPVRTAKFVARKNWVITGSDDMKLSVYNYNVLEKVYHFKAHSDYIRCIAIHPAESYVLSCGDDKLIKLWNWDSKWTCQQIFKGHSHYVMQIVFNPKDANTFASASLDMSVKVWQLQYSTANFTLKGHEKGVNCVDYHQSGDKPYLVTGSDDRRVKIWDYQNKVCIQTLEGHEQNISAVVFHTELPILLTGSEDGTVKIWQVGVFKLEQTLNYSFERVWSISSINKSNNIVIGFDEGFIMVQVGKEKPAISMDVNGHKVVRAKHYEIQQVNLKPLPRGTDLEDGQIVPIVSMKDMGTCEVYPHSIAYSPNNRFVAVCGDGEFIIYTAAALRTKAFGIAQEFVWSFDSSGYAALENSTTIRIFKSFKEVKCFLPKYGAENIFGGFMLGVKSINDATFSFYDWENLDLIRRIDIQPRYVFWSENAEFVCLAKNETFYMLRFDANAVACARENDAEISVDGINNAFKVINVIQENVNSGSWVGDCFIYTNIYNNINYYVGGEIVNISNVDHPIYVLGYAPNEFRLYMNDKDLNIVSYYLAKHELAFYTAVMRQDLETAEHLYYYVPFKDRLRLAQFLEKQGHKKLAMNISTDPVHRFEIAVSIGDLISAKYLAEEATLAEGAPSKVSEARWSRLGTLASKAGEIELTKLAYINARDYSSLLIFAVSSGDKILLEEVAKKSSEDGQDNIAFMAYFTLNKLNECLQLLIDQNKLPETAFFARSYVPSKLEEGELDLCESLDPNGDGGGKKVVVGVCAMAKKSQSKPMKEILTRLDEFEYIKMLVFPEEVILKKPVEEWPICDCLISFHSKGFPLDKAIQYEKLRKPYVINNLHMQYDIQDRRRVYAILENEGIEIPRYAVLDRDSPDPKHHELVESEDHVEVNGVVFNKPFVEKPVSAEDHNIYIYYPTSAGGGSQRLFRKIGSRSSIYSPESRVRKTGSFIYEDFMPTDGTDVKVYTVGPDYAHAEARKSPALDGKVERDSEGKEIRYPVILSNQEKLISRKVCLAFKQTVCGFDLLRANGKSFVCDVNGFSFVKNSNKYYDDCAKILGNMILRELAPTLHIPWSVPFQLDDPPIVPTTFGKMMELRCVVAVIRHGDRTPKQKMKVEVRHPRFFEIFEKYDGFKRGHVKLKKPKQLQEILDIARALLADIHTRHADPPIEEKQGKLEQLKSVLEMYGHFSGINRKVQMKYQPRGRPRGSSSDDGCAGEPSLVLILKWGGELTPAGRIQAEELGRMFRCMYPGGQGRHGEAGTQGLGLLRLHSTFRHDLKIYASDEGRVQMTAAAFAKGLLALEGELTPILVQMVKSANTNGLLDNDCDSSKVQNMAKARLHEAMQADREFTAEDRARINPCASLSINAAMDFVKNPVRCCAHVHALIQQLVRIVLTKRDDPKTKDTVLYHGETWELMGRRWGKIEKDFCTKNKSFDISKIPDIYDCIKYDLQHNQHTLQFDLAEELYMYAKYLADIVIPQEYGLTMQEKLTISQGICTPLLKKIRADLQRNIEESGEENVNRLNPRYSHGVSSPGRHVRTRLYFTSESHVHSLLTVLRFGGLLDVVKDEQWRRAMEYVSMVSELNYMSQIVVMLYEDPTKDPCSEERFHVELHFSPGVNCCVQKNLPPGPGFRPHSRNHSTANNEASSPDEVKCIEEETEDDQMASQETLQPDVIDELDSTFTPTKSSKSKLRPSDPIPICNLHYTVSGHEASTLAARLNEELRARSHTHTDTRPIAQSEEKVTKDGEEPQPRARSYDQHKQAHDNGRRQRHSIAGQMSYLKMLGLARGKLAGAAGLFSTAVISGSSSAPNLRVMIPSAANNNTALEGFGGVPAIRPLETLHNALSLRQLDAFLERLTCAPAPPPANSVGWSGPSSLMSSSGELTSGLSSAGPSSPNSNYAGSEQKNNSESSNWSKNVARKLPQWDGEAATLCAFEGLRPAPLADRLTGSSISGDVTPVSATSELEFNSNEATAGSITDHDIMSAEGEDDEETLSVDACSSPVKIIRNDLSPAPSNPPLRPITTLTSTSLELYGLTPQQTKEAFYKDIPSSSKNFKKDDTKKCNKDRIQCLSNLDSLNLSTLKCKLNNDPSNPRRYSDSSAQKSTAAQTVAGSRFTTTLVSEDCLRASASDCEHLPDSKDPLID
ncbi:unnamed protein product [Colias eurytheme]|nr:unnamed protein product [Colias eurytheme]